MSTYIIGDVQGCHQELQELLMVIDFDPEKDKLGFIGDLVNRGPDSLEVLRFIKRLPHPLIVLGNHDLHLLALGYGVVSYKVNHTLDEVLEAPDKIELLEWLRQQPFLIYEPSFDTLLVHAGTPPGWNLTQSLANAEEAAALLRGPDYLNFLHHLYGSHPLQWEDNLSGWDRARYIVNAFTRMRFCTQTGTLDLNNKTSQSTNPQSLKPWFEWYHQPQRVVFGHWAALEGHTTNPKCEAIDTGCAWGHSLTAICLENGQRFSVPAANSSIL